MVNGMKYSVIAIEREYASGGREIGEKLAERLGIPCYGYEILEKAAVKTGLPLQELAALEESITGSLLYSLSMFADITSGRDVGMTSAQQLALAESDIVRELAFSPCVIIGRGSAGLLHDRANVLKAFVHADVDVRIQRAIDVYGIDPKQAESALRRCDKRRTGYFRAATSLAWSDASIYHLFLNSGKLGIDAAVDILYAAVTIT